MPSDFNYLVSKKLEKRYQMQVNSLAESGASSNDPRYTQAAEQLTGIGRVIDDYEAENRVTDEQGKLVKPPVTRLPVVSDPTQDTSGFNYHFEPSVREAQEALRSNPQLLRQLDPMGEWGGIAEPERQEDVADPASGMVMGQNTVPARTWLDNLTSEDSLYKKYGEHTWEQRINEARERGVGVQRYKDIQLQDDPVDFLAGGADKAVQRVVAPAASAAADVLSMGTADRAGKLSNDSVNEANRKYGLPERKYESAQEIQNRNPGAALAGGLAAYALPGNIINSATELAMKGLGYGSRGALGKAGISALTGGVGNVAEGAVMDTVHGMNAGQSFGDAASASVQNMPTNAAAGFVGGGIFDMIGQGAGNMRESFRRGSTMTDLKTLEDAGGHTSVPHGVVPPPEVEAHIRRSRQPRAVGSPAAYAAEDVAPHIERNLETQAADAQKKIEGEKEQYFNHPAYRDREVSGTPAVATLIDMANEGWARGPVTGAPRNVNPGQIRELGKIVREFTDVPQVVKSEEAEAFAKEWDGVVVDGELGNQLYGLDESKAAPPGYSIVAVPIKLSARKLTDLEARIDAELNMGAARGNNEDPVWTNFNRRIKETRDQFPYYVDDQGNLVPPPDWQDPGAPRPEPEGPVYEGEFVDSARPPGTELEGPVSGPPSSGSPSGGGAPPAPGGGPQLGGGGAPQLPRGMVSPEDATPLSLLAGNKMAMRTEGKELLGRLGKPPFPIGPEYQQFARELSFLLDVPRINGNVVDEIEELASNYKLRHNEYQHVRDALYPGQTRDLSSKGAKLTSLNDINPREPTDEVLGGRKLRAVKSPPGEPTERLLPAARRAPAESRGPLERMLDAGIDRSDAPALPVSEIEDAAFRQQAERDKVAKDWDDTEGQSKQWFEDIVAPGRTPRSDEVKRIMDLTEQQRAVEEAIGQMNNVDRRLGPIPDDQKDEMLIGIISEKLGRKVTKEELVRAGLLAGGVAAGVTAEDSESGAATAAIGGLLSLLPKGSLNIKSRAKLGSLAQVQPKDILEDSTLLDDLLLDVQASDIPDEEKFLIADRLIEYVDLARSAPKTKGPDAPNAKEPTIEEDLASADYDGPMSDGKLFKDERLPATTSREVVDVVNKVNELTEKKLKDLTPIEKNYIQQWGRSSLSFKESFRRQSMSDDEIVQHWKDLGYSDKDIERRKLIDTVKNSEQDKETVKILGGAIEKLKIENPTQYGTLHRGLGAGDKQYRQPDIQELLTKDTFVVRTPISTSYNREASKDFTGRDSKTSPVLLDFIKVNAAAPKFHPGTHSLSADARVREAEVLIPPGATFRVIGRSKEKIKPTGASPEVEATVIKLEQIEDAPREAWKNAAMIGAALGIGAASDEEEAGAGAAGAMAIGMGRKRGKGGGRSKPPGGPTSIMDDLKKPKGPRQLEADLDDGTKVQGFSALRRKQHLAQTALEDAKRRVGATGEKTIRDRVIGFNQGDNKVYDDALLDEAKKVGKEDELYRAAAASVYPGLKDKAWFRGGDGLINRTTNAAGLHLDPLLEALSGAQRNPFIRNQPGVMEDMLREFLNVTGGRAGARHGDDFRRIYEALHGETQQEEDRQQ